MLGVVTRQHRHVSRVTCSPAGRQSATEETPRYTRVTARGPTLQHSAPQLPSRARSWAGVFTPTSDIVCMFGHGCLSGTNRNQQWKAETKRKTKYGKCVLEEDMNAILICISFPWLYDWSPHFKIQLSKHWKSMIYILIHFYFSFRLVEKFILESCPQKWNLNFQLVTHWHTLVVQYFNL